jgi:hypothetical protein
MKAFRRSIYAWIALVGVIFSQLAVAAYACPVLNPLDELAHAMAASAAPATPCAEMDMHQVPGDAALCAEHCDQDKQSVGSPQVPDFQPGLFLVHVLAPMSVSDSAGASFIQASLLARSTSPPPLWRTGRLRI